MKKIDASTLKVIRVSIPLCLSFLVVFGVLIAAVFFPSLGWFSSNRNVNASGMGVKTETRYLIITKTESDVLAATAANGDTLFSVNFGDDDDAEYVPATHDGDYTTYPTGLKTVSEESFIGFYTGTGNEEIEYLPATNSASRTYYRDVDVYVARIGGPLSGATLTVSLSATSDGDPVESGSLMATSVDLYRNSVAQSNLVGTLNVAGLDPVENDAETEQEFVYLVGSDSTTGTIPHNAAAAGDRYLHYVLRCYFDGALLAEEDQTFIRSADLDASAVLLQISFEADVPE